MKHTTNQCTPAFGRYLKPLLGIALFAAGSAMPIYAAEATAQQRKDARKADSVFNAVQKALVDQGLSSTDAAQRALTVVADMGQPVAPATAPVPGNSQETNASGTKPSPGAGSGGAGADAKPSPVASSGQVAGKAPGKETPGMLGPDDDFGAYPRNFFHIGYGAISPYKVDEKGVLDRTGNDSRAFIEFVYNDHWAFVTDDEVLKEDPSVRSLSPSMAKRKSELPTHKDYLDNDSWIFGRFDTEFRAGFTLGGDGDKTASTIAGSGNFNLGGALGYQLLRIGDPNLRISFGPEASGGMTTDLSNFEVHPRVLAGVGWHIGMKPLAKDLGDRRVALTFRVGYGFVDTPRLTTITEGGKELPAVELKNGRVSFDSFQGGLGLESELFYPVTKSSFITLGGRIYENAGADQWSFHIGYVQSLGALWKGFFGDGN